MEDPNGSIAAHTCANLIILPHGLCLDYEAFKVALNACIEESLTFNTV